MSPCMLALARAARATPRRNHLVIRGSALTQFMLKSVDSPGGVNDLGLSKMVLIPTRYCEQSKIKSESLTGKSS
jgi:hypothetical protein